MDSFVTKRARMAYVSGTIFFFGFLGFLISGGLSTFAAAVRFSDRLSLGEAFTRALAEGPMAIVSGAAILIGGLGLLAAGVAYLVAHFRGRGQQSKEDSAADEVARLLEAGNDRDQIRQTLIGAGYPADEADRALRLEWPRGESCPKCGSAVRRFEALNTPGSRWYVCTACEWIGNESALPRPGQTTAGA